MGTSSSTDGPKSPAWSTAKGSATRLANRRPGATPDKVVRQAARALGGSGGGAWSPGSTTTAQRFAALLGQSVTDGFAGAARRFELEELADKPAFEVVMVMLNWISADAVSLDDQSARRSVEAVLSELIREDTDLERPLDANQGIALFRSFLVQYLTRSIITPLEQRLTDNASAPEARSHERHIANVVEGLLQLEISTEQLVETDWLGEEGASVFEQIRRDALDILAGDDS